MTRFFLRRLLLTIPVLVGVATLVFSLIHLVPGDPVQAMLGESASPQDVAQLRTRLGLDRPLYEQYISFAAGVVRGDLGTSLRTNRPVTSVILERMPATLELALAAMVVATAFAIPLGIVAAVRKGTHIDHAASTIALLGISMPTFWLGPLLAIVFSVWLGWFPVSGRGTFANLVLPAVTLGAPLAAMLARMTRASVGPVAEVCNQIDDDCNGVVDDLAGGQPCVVVDVNVDIDGDCVTAMCPANAPYPIACTIMMEGSDSRGCVASSPQGSAVYFQEGDKCGVGHVSGRLRCASQPGAALDAATCPINKSNPMYPASPSGCPHT